ncbi:hypothetical protein AMECASPLE_033882, partial [Ameca splendens]
VSMSCNPGPFNHNPPTAKPWTQFPDRPRKSHRINLPARSPARPLRQSPLGLLGPQITHSHGPCTATKPQPRIFRTWSLSSAGQIQPYCFK